MKLKEISIKSFKGLESISLKDCGAINVLLGKNNSGKSTILHAIEMASLALNVRNWSNFWLKLNMEDLFPEGNQFEIEIKYPNEEILQIHSDNFSPRLRTDSPKQSFKSLLFYPDSHHSLLRRNATSPHDIMQGYIKNNSYHEVNALGLLHTLKRYSDDGKEGFNPNDYQAIIQSIQEFFPQIEIIDSKQTLHNIPTLVYKEKYSANPKKLDILYAGSGIRQFLDILVKVTISKADVLLLDEPEVGMHPDLQRDFMRYLIQLSKAKNMQIFMATHSPVILNYTEDFTYFRVLNNSGKRLTRRIASNDTIETALGDLGIRPSDFFGSDICIMVEGPTDVIFWECVLELYRDELQDIVVNIVQFNGKSAHGLINEKLKINNIIPFRKNLLWIHDKDSGIGESPNKENINFCQKIEECGYQCHILKKRELEFYFPEPLHVANQRGDLAKEVAIKEILRGNQNAKYSTLVEAAGAEYLSGGVQLKNLLKQHLNQQTLDEEIKEIMGKVLEMRDGVLGSCE